MNIRNAGTVGFSLRTIAFAVISLALLQFLVACDYARMKDDESLRTYKKSIPEMPKESIPVTGGIEILRQTDPKSLQNPLPFDQAAVERGKIAYEYYCVHCHGPKANGHGTVGQSFAPLPTNLNDKYVQEQTDGEIFYRTSLGFNRHPALASTVAEEDRWAIIHFIRSLAKQTSG